MTSQTCTDHCAACDRHFHGLSSFDAHRVDDACADPEAVVGTHRDGSLYAPLKRWTAAGICRLGRGGQEWPVTIWNMALDATQQAALDRLRRK